MDDAKAAITVVVLTRASVFPAIASDDSDSVRFDVRHIVDVAALRALVHVSALCVVLTDVSGASAELASECRRIGEILPTCVRVGFVYSVRLLTRWHLDALYRGQLHAIVDAFVPPAALREVLVAVSHGALVLRVNADPAHTMTLSPATVRGSVDLDTLSDDDRIVALSALGSSEREIGFAVHLSASAVHHRLERVRARLGLRNRIELAAWAGQVGLYRLRGSDSEAPEVSASTVRDAASAIDSERAGERHPV